MKARVFCLFLSLVLLLGLMAFIMYQDIARIIAK